MTFSDWLTCRTQKRKPVSVSVRSSPQRTGLIGALERLQPQYEALALLPFIMGALLAVSAIRITSWNSRSKMSDMIVKLDKEIAQMKSKLRK
jgi:hypothetical protein